MTNTKKVKINKAIVFTPVVSSMIKEYARANNDLALRLNNGSAYICKNVSDSVFNAFLKASSKGKFFSTDLKNKFVVEAAE